MITDAPGKGISFQVGRKLDTGDTAQDMALECGKDYKSYYMFNEKTNSLSKHTGGKPFTLSFSKDCSFNGAIYQTIAWGVALASISVAYLY